MTRQPPKKSKQFTYKLGIWKSPDGVNERMQMCGKQPLNKLAQSLANISKTRSRLRHPNRPGITWV